MTVRCAGCRRVIVLADDPPNPTAWLDAYGYELCPSPDHQLHTPAPRSGHHSTPGKDSSMTTDSTILATVTDALAAQLDATRAAVYMGAVVAAGPRGAKDAAEQLDAVAWRLVFSGGQS